jgi:hypothetical protein
MPAANVALYAWCLYPVLVPFYLLGRDTLWTPHKLPGGLPQPADFYVVAVMALALFALPFRVPGPVAAALRGLAAFVGYAALVNFLWASILEDASLVRSALFYAYDVLLFLTVLLLASRFGERFLRLTVRSVAASVFLQAALSPFVMTSLSDRQQLFFHSENQLGYYAVLAATIFAAGARRFHVPVAVRLAFYAAVGYLTLISQCRAAVTGLVALALVAALGRSPWRFLAAVAALAVLYAAVTFAPEFLGKSRERLVTSGEYDTLAARGYDRIGNYPEYLFFGAGEGAYGRFQSDLYDSEIHSSFGTLLFCYGIVGAGLFACALLPLARKDPKTALYLVPAFVHGFAHQGLRFAFFWVMLAFLYCLAASRRAGHPEGRGDPDGGDDPAAHPGSAGC